MKQRFIHPILILVLFPCMLLAQDELSFSELDSPIMLLGSTDTGLKLEFRKAEAQTYYRWTFPVNEFEANLGMNHIEFVANDEELEALRVHMIKSMTGVFDTTDYTIGDYTMEIFTNKKTVHGKEKRIGQTKVTMYSKDDGSPTDKIKFDGKVQEGYFSITEGQVNVLFGKAKF